MEVEYFVCVCHCHVFTESLTQGLKGMAGPSGPRGRKGRTVCTIKYLLSDVSVTYMNYLCRVKLDFPGNVDLKANRGQWYSNR